MKVENKHFSALNLSHNQQDSQLQTHLSELTEKIQKRGDLPYISIAEQLKILEDLASFPLGQFLIENKGLNG